MTTIEIAEIGPGLYRVRYANRILIASCRDPVFSACRKLKALGVTGAMEMRRDGCAYASMRVDIERGAQLTVNENRSGTRIVLWRPFGMRTKNEVTERELVE